MMFQLISFILSYFQVALAGPEELIESLITIRY